MAEEEVKATPVEEELEQNEAVAVARTKEEDHNKIIKFDDFKTVSVDKNKTVSQSR